MKAEELVARLLYKDALMLVVNKPAGLPVHAGPKGGQSLESLFDALRFGLPRVPALAHRLDRDTTGCLVLGRHRKALAKMGKLFSGGRVEKTYWAVVAGKPPAAEGRIDLALSKQTSDKRSWWMKVDPNGMPTVTDYKLMGSAEGLSWLELYPRTGRTHQIRVHCAAIGCPVLGDNTYGGEATRAGEFPLHLHSRAITLPLYPTRDPITIDAPAPEHMLAQLKACGFAGDPPRAPIDLGGPSDD
ncbi:MAG TPA: RNA pseudouridine synthase [Alphaproteobacteria bacterium]|nr:RNA pseudouridine synthase [Alphaproteobacteria bacterium]